MRFKVQSCSGALLLVISTFVCNFPHSVAGTNERGLKYLAENGKKPGVTTLPSGLQYKVLKSGPGSGKTPERNSPCQCHYKGTLIDGTEFDSSYKRGKPATFAPSQVIKGWTEAMQLMREGDKWELTIPSELAYGDGGSGSRIPGGAALVFEMELIKVNDPSPFSLFGFDLMDPQVLMMVAGVGFMLWQVKSSFAGSGPALPRVSLEDAADEKDPRVFFEMSVSGEVIGQIEMQLFAKIVPKTAENFRCLCTGEKTNAKGKPLHFKDSIFHRVIPSFMCQGGDFTRHNGTGGESIYGSKFEDEWDNGVIAHSKPMLLSMANAGKNTNGSQFFLTVAKTPWLDGKHVVFGQVVQGQDVVKQIEALGSSSGQTLKRITISDCGEVKTKDS